MNTSSRIHILAFSTLKSHSVFSIQYLVFGIFQLSSILLSCYLQFDCLWPLLKCSSLKSHFRFADVI